MAATRPPKRTTATARSRIRRRSRRRPDQPIPAQPAPRPKDAPRTMKELRAGPRGQARRRAPSPSRTSCARACASSASPTRRSWSCSARPATSPTARSSRRSTTCGGRTCCPTSSSLLAIGRRPYDDETFRAEIRDVAREVQPGPAARRRTPGARSPSGSHYQQLRLRRRRPASTTWPTRLDDDRRGARHARQPALLPRDPAVAVRRDRRPARAGSGSTTSATTAAGGGSSSRSRSATTSTSAKRLNREVGKVFRESQVYRIDHYLGQGDGPEPAGLPLRQRHLRAALEPPLRRPRPDHRGRVDRRREPRRVLRGDRRGARRPPEPPAPAGQPGRDGAAGDVRGGRAARREGQGPAGDQRADPPTGSGPTWCAASTGRAGSAATQVAGLSRGAGGRPGVGDRDVRRRPARRSTTGAGPASRSTCAPASACRSARPRSRSSSARCPTGCSSDAGAEPEPNLLAIRIQPDEGIMLRFGAKVPGLGLDVRSVTHGLHLRLGVQRRLARRLRDADPRRAARATPRCSPGPTRSRRRGRSSTRSSTPWADDAAAGRSRTTTPARGARTRPTSCWPATAGGGGGSDDHRRRPPRSPSCSRPASRAGRSCAGRSRAPTHRRASSRSSPGSGASLDAARHRSRSTTASSIATSRARTSVMNLVVVARRPEIGERCAATIQT